MRGLRLLRPPNQEIDQDTAENYQNHTDPNQTMRHTVHYLVEMLHKRGLMGKAEAAMSRPPLEFARTRLTNPRKSVSHVPGWLE